MSVRIHLVASHVDEADTTVERLRSQAREHASRKVLRFLDAASLAAFNAAASLYRRAPVAAPEHVALYTVGRWDGDMPDPPFLSDGSAEGDSRLSRHILEDANPVDWLRMLSNNALCQVSIAEGFRGPNLHLVGDAAAAAQVISVSAADLASGAAEQALVVAYDTLPEHRHHPSGRAPARAAALSLALSPEGGRDDLPRLLELADSLSEAVDSPMEVISRCAEEIAPLTEGAV
ncbi:hypothetical protein [Nocardiopsis alborubida]|uniref:Uncharacterized protein n=1 Tax=Nocardiopsis alborubida TaxID=146802 RepID=A0A7X6MA93_9ACTN|nr:hypothetical protein [Nocardiopsis alborubida]NKY97205.1 hypothetical protein [Nocardiopsis alborubida]